MKTIVSVDPGKAGAAIEWHWHYKSGMSMSRVIFPLPMKPYPGTATTTMEVVDEDQLRVQLPTSDQADIVFYEDALQSIRPNQRPRTAFLAGDWFGTFRTLYGNKLYPIQPRAWTRAMNVAPKGCENWKELRYTQAMSSVCNHISDEASPMILRDKAVGPRGGINDGVVDAVLIMFYVYQHTRLLEDYLA